MLFMVIEQFRDNDMIPVYEKLRDAGRMLPEGLRYVDSWVEVSWARFHFPTASPSSWKPSFIIRAIALGLQQVPTANAVWDGDRILRFAHSGIGVAVALDGGLITPVIRHAETKSLSAISTEMRDLMTRARAKKLKPAEYQGGAAAISNLGMHGVREFSAIINPTHATILAVGAARRQAIETDDGGVAFASMLSLTLSCDHRVVDGALGAELLATIKRLIESPVTMLV